VIVTNTLPIAPAKRERLGDKLVEISVAPLLGEAIHRIHQGISVGAMYEQI
jgi:ribose-phosphate pyrophosphokinase